MHNSCATPAQLLDNSCTTPRQLLHNNHFSPQVIHRLIHSSVRLPGDDSAHLGVLPYCCIYCCLLLHYCCLLVHYCCLLVPFGAALLLPFCFAAAFLFLGSVARTDFMPSTGQFFHPKSSVGRTLYCCPVARTVSRPISKAGFHEEDHASPKMPTF